MVGNLTERDHQRGAVDIVSGTEQVDVGEVPPACIHGATLSGGDDLLREDRLDRVAPQLH